MISSIDYKCLICVWSRAKVELSTPVRGSLFCTIYELKDINQLSFFPLFFTRAWYGKLSRARVRFAIAFSRHLECVIGKWSRAETEPSTLARRFVNSFKVKRHHVGLCLILANFSSHVIQEHDMEYYREYFSVLIGEFPVGNGAILRTGTLTVGQSHQENRSARFSPNFQVNAAGIRKCLDYVLQEHDMEYSNECAWGFPVRLGPNIDQKTGVQEVGGFYEPHKTRVKVSERRWLLFFLKWFLLFNWQLL